MIDPSDIHNENSDAEIKGSCHSVDTDDCPIVIEKTFNKVFFPTIYEDRTSSVLFLELREYARSKCLPTRQCSVSYIKILFPFWSWLKTYEIAWLPNDIVSGITIAIMQIPQGMAYALLAGLSPITGLYISFFSPLVYALFGTSKHLAIGAVAVISLMTGNVVDRLTVKPILTTMSPFGFNNTTIETGLNTVMIDQSYNIYIATNLAFLVGIIQLILSVFHLGFITSFLSDAFISGYTTGSAVLVYISQTPDLLGISIKKNVGPFSSIYSCIEIFYKLPKTNLVTLLVSTCCILSLVLVKEYIEPWYKRKIKEIKLFKHVQIPIPMELIVIILGTVVSYSLDLNRAHQVKIVNTIDQGFRKPQCPSITMIPVLIKDAIMIAVVAYAISMSIAKTFAKKLKYTINSNQELTAFGACNIIGSFFGTYPCAGSLSRTSVYVSTGGRTQLASLFTCATILIVILRIGALFELLPKACLASIIIVALKGLILQIKDIYTIGRVTNLEAIVWITTFLSTIMFDVDYGLFLGITASLIVVILRQFRPRRTILGQYDRNEAYKQGRRISKAHEIPHIKIYCFESSIIYFNADFFRETLLEAVNIDPRSGQRRKYDLEDVEKSNSNLSELTHVIIDCSPISQIDYSGGKIFLQAIRELNDCQLQVYLCHLRYYNHDVLQKLKMDKVCSVTVTATIHDAIHDIQSNLRENNDKLLLMDSNHS